MSVRDWLEQIRACVVDIAEFERKAEESESKLLPGGGVKAATIGAVPRERMDPAIVAAEYRMQADLLGVKLTPELDRALHALYGKSGRGGLAKARTYTDADIICGYYLQGLSWKKVADEMCTGYDGKYPSQWCRSRAITSIGYMERVGLDALTES